MQQLGVPELDVAALFEAHHSEIFYYLFRHTNGDRPLSEDLASATWERAWDRRRQYRDQGLPVAAWLFRIAHNLLVDHIRAVKNKQSWSLDGLVFAELEPSVTVRFDDIHNQEILAQALARLTVEQRAVIIYRFFSGYSTAETASLVGKTEDAVKKLQARALERMRGILENQPNRFARQMVA